MWCNPQHPPFPSLPLPPLHLHPSLHISLGTVPSEGLGREATGGSLGMGSVDDSLADLKPEDSEGEEDMPPRPALTPEQEVMS